MSKKDEALKLALEALEDLQRQYAIYPNSFWDWSKGRKAITALREALAEQPAQQEPDWKDQYEKQKRRAEMWIAKYEADIGPLEKAGPVTAQQEPVAITTGMALAFHRALTDGPINDAEAKEIKIGLEAAFAHLTTPQAQPAQSSKPFDTHAAPGQSFDTHSRTPQQEPVGKKTRIGLVTSAGWDSLPVGTEFYTSPQAQRTWVGLTDEDIKEAEWLLSAIKEHEAYTLQEQLLVEGVDVFARAIEAKLREKNA